MNFVHNGKRYEIQSSACSFRLVREHVILLEVMFDGIGVPSALQLIADYLVKHG